MEGSTDTTLEKISGDGDRWLTVATKAGWDRKNSYEIQWSQIFENMAAE